MHVVQFFLFLGVAPDVEIVEAALPEATSVAEIVVERERQLLCTSSALADGAGESGGPSGHSSASVASAWGKLVDEWTGGAPPRQDRGKLALGKGRDSVKKSKG